MKNKILAVICLSIICGLISGCNVNQTSNINESNVTSDESDKSIKQSLTSNTQDSVSNEISISTSDVDLSEYIKHGEWSCGRIWVQKHESSWNSSESYFGYLNENGVVVGDWHSEWKYPFDYVNGYAIIAKNFNEDRKYIDFDIVNINGEVINSIKVYRKIGAYPPVGTYTSAGLTQFNEYGTAFYASIYENSQRYQSIIMLNGDGTELQLDDNLKISLENLDGFQGYFSEGYMYYCSYINGSDRTFYGDNYSSTINTIGYYLDENGKIALDFSDGLESYFGWKYNIKKLYPVENGVGKVVFEGQDGKDYFIAIDMKGNLLTSEPLDISQIDSYKANSDISTSLNTNSNKDVFNSYLEILENEKYNILKYDWLDESNSGATSLCDINSDGIPELFYFSVDSVEDDYIANLHIYTYHNSKAEEIDYCIFNAYDIYNNGYSEGLYNYPYLMDQELDNGTHYVVYKGKEPNTLYFFYRYNAYTRYSTLMKYTVDNNKLNMNYSLHYQRSARSDVNDDQYRFSENNFQEIGVSEGIERFNNAYNDCSEVILYSSYSISDEALIDKPTNECMGMTFNEMYTYLKNNT